MTDRINAYVVILEEETREDSGYAAATLAAIQQIKGVSSVVPHVSEGGIEGMVASDQMRSRVTMMLRKILDELWERT